MNRFRNVSIALCGLVLWVTALSGCGTKPEAPADSSAARETVSTEPTVSEMAEPMVSTESETTAEETTMTEKTTAEKVEPAKPTVLVVYFSATGTTKGVALKIAALTKADVYEIVPEQPYTEADLNYHDSQSRTTLEQNDPSVRPQIHGELPSLKGYTTVYLGYPIWWGDAPRILSTFVESLRFDGITVVPFCTSGGSGIGRSERDLETLAKSGNWRNGQRFESSVSEADLQTWIQSVK